MKIYGEWFDAAMEKRRVRDGITEASLRRVLVESGWGDRRYLLRGYAYQDSYGQWWTYTLRRDGRVGRSWVPIAESRIRFDGIE